MDQLMTPDGTICIWDSQKDISELCRKYISDDVANYVYDLIGDIESENEYQRMLADSDYRAMEMENEGYRDALYDVSSQLQEISVKADEPGFSKKKIVAMIDEVWSQINRTL